MESESRIAESDPRGGPQDIENGRLEGDGRFLFLQRDGLPG